MLCPFSHNPNYIRRNKNLQTLPYSYWPAVPSKRLDNVERPISYVLRAARNGSDNCIICSYRRMFSLGTSSQLVYIISGHALQYKPSISSMRFRSNEAHSSICSLVACISIVRKTERSLDLNKRASAPLCNLFN